MSESPKRKAPDWEAIEREYRAGQLSIRQIAVNHGVTHGGIRKRAGNEGWTRDLTEKVQQAVKQRVVSSAVSSAVSKALSREKMDTEREIIAAAADRGAQAIHGHLARAANLNSLADVLMGKLRRALASEEAFPKELLLGKGDSLSALLRAAADVVERAANMERKALNLDGQDGEDKPILCE